MRKSVLAVVSMAILGACASGPDGLRRLTNGDGPDEFSVQPAQPLVVPDAAGLPSPGGGNRAITDPRDQAIVALGGTPVGTGTGAVPAQDAALVSFAARNGVAPDIRATTSAEDAQFRRRAERLSWFNILGRDRYFPAYARQSLDAQAEYDRFQAAGVGVPSAPPR